MSKNWTKGPWGTGHFTNTEHPCDCRYIFDEGHLGGIATIHVFDGDNDAPPKPEAIANAHLISAAPELYDALENLLNGIRSDLVKIDAIADETWANAMCKADAALAKARGES